MRVGVTIEITGPSPRAVCFLCAALTFKTLRVVCWVGLRVGGCLFDLLSHRVDTQRTRNHMHEAITYTPHILLSRDGLCTGWALNHHRCGVWWSCCCCCCHRQEVYLDFYAIRYSRQARCYAHSLTKHLIKYSVWTNWALSWCVLWRWWWRWCLCSRPRDHDSTRASRTCTYNCSSRRRRRREGVRVYLRAGVRCVLACAILWVVGNLHVKLDLFVRWVRESSGSFFAKASNYIARLQWRTVGRTCASLAIPFNIELTANQPIYPCATVLSLIRWVFFNQSQMHGIVVVLFAPCVDCGGEQ